MQSVSLFPIQPSWGDPHSFMIPTVLFVDGHWQEVLLFLSWIL